MVERITLTRELPFTPQASDGSTLSGIIQIAAGLDHTCALMDGGQVQCWGSGHSGELGLGEDITLTSKASVVQGLIGVDIVEVVASGSFNCALSKVGRIWCWGDGTKYKLGNNNNEDAWTSVVVQDSDGDYAAGAYRRSRNCYQNLDCQVHPMALDVADGGIVPRF